MYSCFWKSINLCQLGRNSQGSCWADVQSVAAEAMGYFWSTKWWKKVLTARRRPCAQGSSHCALVPLLSLQTLFSNRFSVRLLQGSLCITLSAFCCTNNGVKLLSVPWLKGERSPRPARWILFSLIWDFISLLPPYLFFFSWWYSLLLSALGWGQEHIFVGQTYFLILLAFVLCLLPVYSLSLSARL